MMSTSIATVVKMMEALPEYAQNQVAEKIREYIEELQDEIIWDSLFMKTQNKLIEAAKQAKREIGLGYAKTMDYDQL